ncbi:MAG: TetR/AcrR family transcriptional regulator [Firmicutes bacterium]|nr:TetR/AcrR family transcriptional regulator [Bacillota bacterium]
MLEKSQEEKILDAAYNVIAREGYAQTSLRQIAEEAQVALSQISYHFQNKEGLLLAVGRRVADRYSEFVQELQPDMTPWEKGECFLRLYQEILTKEPELFRVLYDLVGLALRSEPLREQVREIFQVIINLFATEVFTGDLLEELGYTYSPEVLSGLFLGGIFGIAVQILLEPKETAYLSFEALNMVFRLRKR